MERPKTSDGYVVTTPRAKATIEQRSARQMRGEVVFSPEEFADIRRLYPSKRKVGEEPCLASFSNSWDGQKAVATYERECAIEQLRADREALNDAETDGLRILAWVARYCKPGTDPLKLIVKMAARAGCGATEEDLEWADE